MRLITSFILLFIPSLSFAQGIFKLNPEQIVKNIQCKKSVEKLMNDWQVTREFEKSLGNNMNEVTLTSPTNQFAKWFALSVKNKKVLAQLISPKKTLRVFFQEDCTKKMYIGKNQLKISENQFNDIDLKKLVRKNKEGLIYVWSPNMPLSIDGIKEIQAAAKKSNLPLTILLDREAEVEFAKKELRRRKISSIDIKQYNSLEMAFRGASLHLPALLPYKNGKLFRRAKPGHEYEWKFSQYINTWMKK